MKDGKQMVCKYLSVRTFRISKFQQRSSQVLHKGLLEAAVAGRELSATLNWMEKMVGQVKIYWKEIPI